MTLRCTPFRLGLLGCLALGLLGGCDLFGSKGDDTTDEILDEGRTDPTLPEAVGYVPLNPFFTQGLDGPFDRPTDVYVGYDELVYVTDRRGLHILDLAGRPQALVSEVLGQPLRDVQAVVQDRRLDVYVAARRDTTVAGADCRRYPGQPERCDLAVIYHFAGTTTGQARLVDILWHPFDDGSRQFRFTLPDTYPAQNGATYSDEDAVFTGVAVLADNTLYATRSGPVNEAASGRPNAAFGPFNAFLQFVEVQGDAYLQFAFGLSPSQPSLLSAFWPSDVITFVGPPQRGTFGASQDFVISQAPPQGGLRYGVLSIRVVETPNGTEFQVDTRRLNAASTPGAGSGFLYGSFRFDRPVGLAYAADATGYLFVVDEGKDSLFVFNNAGVEGVAPPPGGGPTTTPVPVSFGGLGSGPRQFVDPQGVAYYRRTVYVADSGNNRVSRFQLNTDLE